MQYPNHAIFKYHNFTTQAASQDWGMPAHLFGCYRQLTTHAVVSAAWHHMSAQPLGSASCTGMLPGCTEILVCRRHTRKPQESHKKAARAQLAELQVCTCLGTEDMASHKQGRCVPDTSTTTQRRNKAHLLPNLRRHMLSPGLFVLFMHCCIALLPLAHAHMKA